MHAKVIYVSDALVYFSLDTITSGNFLETCKIVTWLQWKTNWKSYVTYQISAIGDDLHWTWWSPAIWNLSKSSTLPQKICHVFTAAISYTFTFFYRRI